MRLRHDVLDLSRPLVARKSFRHNGKTYEVGMAFPWRQLAVSERKIRTMVGSGHVHMAQEPEAKPVKKQKASKAKAKPKAKD